MEKSSNLFSRRFVSCCIICKEVTRKKKKKRKCVPAKNTREEREQVYFIINKLDLDCSYVRDRKYMAW